MQKRSLGPSRRGVIGGLGASLLIPSAAGATNLAHHGGTAFGTHWRISAPEQSDVAPLLPEIADLFEDIDSRFSPWRAESTISKFNLASDEASISDPALIEVTSAALTISEQSEGMFDPTVGPLVARWGFGPIFQGSGPDWRAIQIGPSGMTKVRRDLTLDLCGIAKGWALDQAVAVVQSAGLRDFLFDLGGEFRAIGRHPTGRDWRIAVEAPEAGMQLQATLRLPSGLAAATSGIRSQSYELNNQIYGHIIDPAREAPVMDNLRSVTVATSDAMTADGWATALFAAGEEAGVDIAMSHKIAALFLVEKEGVLHQVRTGQISELML